MADVTPDRPTVGDRDDPDGRNDRAQLFLVGAISLAVLLVGLALLLNTAIYTENVATRSGAGAGDAVTYVTGGKADLAATIEYVNYNRNGTDPTLESDYYELMNESVVDATVEWRNQTAVGVAFAGRTVDVNFVDPHGGGDPHSPRLGTRIVQDVDRPFTRESDSAADWVLVDDDDAIRSFRLKVANSGLTDVSDLFDDPAFNVTLEADGSTDYNISVVRDSSLTSETVVVVNDIDTQTEVGRCSHSGNYAFIDVTAGTINGTTCGPLLEVKNNIVYTDEDAGADNLDVVINEGDQATGQFELFTTERFSNVNEVDTTGDQYKTTAIFAAHVTVEYETPTVEYAVTETVVPEGPTRIGGGRGTNRNLNVTVDNLEFNEDSSGDLEGINVTWSASDGRDLATAQVGGTAEIRIYVDGSATAAATKQLTVDDGLSGPTPTAEVPISITATNAHTYEVEIEIVDQSGESDTNSATKSWSP